MVAQAVATIALGLLGASGAAKLVDPEPTTGAMGLAGLPSSNTFSRLLGFVEIAAAVAGLAIGGITVVIAGGLYTGFAVFTLSAVANRIPLQSCGCFGREDTPPTSMHVVFNVVSALALLSLPFLGHSPVDWTLPATQLLLYGGFAATGMYASYLLLTRLPQLTNAAMSR